MSYNSFACVYDKLMSDCDYTARAEYLLGLFARFDKKPKLMLDLACGTGSLSVELVKKGIDVIAVDASSDMLSVARQKAADSDLELMLLCQDAAELDLYGTVDGAVCTLDSINHITDIDKLKDAFNKVSLFLEKGSLFIFDVNSEYKHSVILADNTFVVEEDNVYCVWQNFTDFPMTEIRLDFFIEDEDGSYTRECETFSERAYSDEQLSKMCIDAGFEVVGVFDDMTTESANETSERKVFVVRKI